MPRAAIAQLSLLLGFFLVSTCSLADLDVSLSWQNYEQRIEGRSRSREITPEDWTLGLSWHSERDVMVAGAVSVGYWQGDWDANTDLELKTRGATVSVAKVLSRWVPTVGFAVSDSRTYYNSRFSIDEAREKAAVLEWFASASQDYTWATWWLSPMLTLAWQKSEVQQTFELPTRNIAGRREQDFDGSSAEASIYGGYDQLLEASVLGVYLGLTWREVLSGTVVERSDTYTARWSIEGETVVVEDDSEGNGRFVLGLAWSNEALSVDLELSEAIDNAFYGRSAVIALGYRL